MRQRKSWIAILLLALLLGGCSSRSPQETADAAPDEVPQVEPKGKVYYTYFDTVSYVYDYAKNRGNQYVLLDGVKLGDADGDGSVNVSDVTTIQRYLAELETLEGIYLHAADANQDGSVDISDATALQMYIAEYALPYPIGEAITQ